MTSDPVRMSLDHVADGGNLAEEVISSVRTAQAFGTQRILSGLFDTHVQKSYAAELKSSICEGGGLAFIYFAIYASYALGKSQISSPDIYLNFFQLSTSVLP